MLIFQFISIGSNLASLIPENKHVIPMSPNYYTHIQSNLPIFSRVPIIILTTVFPCFTNFLIST